MNFIDLHCDTLLALSGSLNAKTAVDLVDHPFENYVQTMAAFIRENDRCGFDTYNRLVNVLKAYSLSNNIKIYKNGEIPKSGVMLSVENACFLAEDISRIYKLYNDGVRMLSLTWNGDNALASGAYGDGGITDIGKEVIRKMNELKMPLDISHLNERSALEACDLADNVLASHSCAGAIHPHRRNLSDRVICALKEKNGIIGLCFYPEFLGGKEVDFRLKSQIDHLISLGMEKNICVGSDYDGAEMAPELSSTAQIPRLFRALLGQGFKKSLCDAIFYENAIAFFGKICENK